MTNGKTIWLLLITGVSALFTLTAGDIYALHESEDDHADHHEDEISSDHYSTDANPLPSENKVMMAYPTVHDMSLVVVFDSTQGILHSKDFTYFSQTAGFDRSRSADKASSDRPSFVLEGIVTANHQSLYDLVDYVWEKQDIGYRAMYAQSDFYIAILEDNIPLRVFKYSDCKVTDYKVDTLYDGVFTYDPNGGGGRAFVDSFSFECEGYKPLNQKSIEDAKHNIMAKLEKQTLKNIGNGKNSAENEKSTFSTSQVLPENTWNQ